MNIKILDSWLREHLKTKASAEKIAEILSLTSISVEKIEKLNDDYIYDIEVTSNRPELMSVIGIAKEASAILPQFGINAEFVPLNIEKNLETVKNSPLLEIDIDPRIVNRVCAVIIDVKIKNSPKFIQGRLESTGIRSLNNLIDITNYVMREVGHPTHVFDYDRIKTHKLIIRESKKNEKIKTLDEKEYQLKGGDIVADDGTGQIVDLLGVMGTANSVVTDKTKRIIFFIDNNDPYKIRKTSMVNGIRTEAAVINEKGIDPEIAIDALLRGIKLYEEFAEGKVVSKIIDIYPNKPKAITIKSSFKKINKIIGVDISPKKSTDILKSLDFKLKIEDDNFSASVPTVRINDVSIEEDLAEEIARIYGYHKLPSIIPPLTEVENENIEKNEYYWTKRIKNTFKYWGFNEVYTYSMVSEEMLECPTNDAVEIANPLTEDMIYMRKTIIPSLLAVIKENTTREEIKIFEITNAYEKVKNDLPKETQRLAGIIKKSGITFFDGKGILEQLFNDLGINDINYKESEKNVTGASVYVKGEYLGELELLDEDIIDFELDFNLLLSFVSLKKTYKPIGKYPAVFEDLAFAVENNVKTSDIINEIKKQSDKIINVELLDQYKNTKTFHVVYQDPEKNLNSEDIKKIRNKIITSVKEKFNAAIKN